ncbi:MAG: AraC-like DNA-binding protein [Polaribacter sp.]|jgi:AraC-like DNA-binding protein
MIYIAGASIALFISALLLNKKQKSNSDIILLLWMLLLAAHLALFYANYFTEISPILIGVHLPIPLLQAVFLYFYVATVTNQFPKKKSVVLLHLLPALLSYSFLIPFFLLPGDEKSIILENKGKGYSELFGLINLILIFAAGIVYVCWSSFLLWKHKKNIRNQFSTIEDINLKWLKLLIVGIGAIWVIVIFFNNGFYIFRGVAIFVILIGFFGVQQRDIFSNVKSLKQNPSKEKKVKYASSGLSTEIAENLYKNLIEQITKESYYTESSLSLNDLAQKLDISPNYLSQIINEKEEKNFFDFINAFRVAEFKRLIAVPTNQQYTLLALAYDCGFNSKSSFNRSFKKHTGFTPSQYALTVQK